MNVPGGVKVFCIIDKNEKLLKIQTNSKIFVSNYNLTILIPYSTKICLKSMNINAFKAFYYTHIPVINSIKVGPNNSC